MDKKQNNALPVWALVFAFIFPAVGIILSIVSLAKKCQKKGMAIAALIISIVWQSVLAIIIVVIGSTIGLGTMLIGGIASYEKDQIQNVDGKKLTNYYYDSQIVSAQYFHREDGSLVYEDIPNDQLEDLVDAMDSLTIVQTSGFHTDYFYGMQRGVQCTLADGTYFTFDGEQLKYYKADGNYSSRFLYFDRPFEEVLDEFLASHGWVEESENELPEESNNAIVAD